MGQAHARRVFALPSLVSEKERQLGRCEFKAELSNVVALG